MMEGGGGGGGGCGGLRLEGGRCELVSLLAALQPNIGIPGCGGGGWCAVSGGEDQFVGLVRSGLSCTTTSHSVRPSHC